MRDKQSKKVVIINDIYSDTIEQAIFILRSAGTPAPEGTPTGNIVKEAQNIINAYIKTIEKTKIKADKNEFTRGKKQDAKRWRLVKVILTLTSLSAVGWMLYSIFSAILVKG